MKITLGHLFYIAALLATLMMSILLLFSNKLNGIFDGRYSKPSKVRIFWGIFCLLLFLSGAAALILNWPGVTPMGRIPF
jgi:hypothetical protein